MSTGKRDPSDYSRDDIALIYSEMQGDVLTRAVEHGAFPQPDYFGDDNEPYWHESTVLSYTEGRATIETASGQNAVAADFIRMRRDGGTG